MSKSRMSPRYHVYPTSLDAEDIGRSNYEGRVIHAPNKDCALCRVGQCVQTVDATDLVVIHGLSALN